MRSLGFNNGNLTKLHQLKGEEDSELSEKEYQRQIEYLAYDMLYGKNYQYDSKKPYKKVDMRMGTIPITVENMTVMGDSIYVQGIGFTDKSRIFLNGEKIDTTMLSEYSLMAKDAKLKEGDQIMVGQASSKREVLGYSEPIYYSEEEHLVVEKKNK
jgi:hypothetical protein